MRGILSLVLATVFPVVMLAWLFALSYLEDTLPRDMRSARRTPDPPPILRVPVRARVEPAPLFGTLPVEPAAVVAEEPVEPAPARADEPVPTPVLVAELAADVPEVPEVPDQRVPEENVPAAAS
jgi:hypothetical protein